jgi:hypothetical protein
MWGWTWDSFVHRTAFGGPQQFIRISTPVSSPGGLAARWNRELDSTGQPQAAQTKALANADERLRNFLPRWLLPVDYDQEYHAWQASKTPAAP